MNTEDLRQPAGPGLRSPGRLAARPLQHRVSGASTPARPTAAAPTAALRRAAVSVIGGEVPREAEARRAAAERNGMLTASQLTAATAAPLSAIRLQQTFPEVVRRTGR